MLRRLFVFVVCLMAAVATASAQTPPDNEIWYTTTDGRTISFNDNDLVSNSYNNGRGVLKFRDSVTSIGVLAFRSCSSLTSITIPNSVTSIDSCAFEGCSSLTSVTIGDSVTSIECEAFKGCSRLTSITIPNSVTSIGRGAFDGCSSLKSVKVSNWYCYDYFKDEVDDIAFYGANASDDGRCLIIDGELKKFIAKGITEYTIPDTVTSIGGGAFYGCSRLTCITIPNSVTSIEYGTFWNCYKLTSITCLATTPPAIGDLKIGETTIIYVPKKAVKAYKKDLEWSRYKKQIKPHIEAK